MVGKSWWRWLASLHCLLAVLCCVSPSRADSAAIGFSNLVFRVDGDGRIGIAKHDYRVHILEELRRLGFNAVGAEDLVFDKDRSRAAELVLGGTMRELECQEGQGTINCRIGVEWQLLDMESDRVVYKVMTRFAVHDHNLDYAELGRDLVIGALRSMADKERFHAAIHPAKQAPPVAASFEPEVFRRCTAAAAPMPGSAENVIVATVIVETQSGFGSGFYVSPDGLVLTAAHVVRNATRLKVWQRDGKELPAALLRASSTSDVALLKVEAGSETPCLGLETGETPTGADVYAVGAPTSRELGFSLTRGIVSGSRTINGEKLLQTDASVSPGNSGGPLVNAQGRVAGVVSFKVLGQAVEGVAFGVPILSGLTALALSSGDSSGSRLLESKMSSSGAPLLETVVDEEDELPSLDPEADRAAEVERAAIEAEERREKSIPGHIKVMRYGGLTLAGVGLVVALRSALAYDRQTMTYEEYEALRVQNDLGWAAVALGGVSVGLSLLLEPAAPPESKGVARAGSVRLLVGPGSIGARVTY